jgi:hypothetical protein
MMEEIEQEGEVNEEGVSARILGFLKNLVKTEITYSAEQNHQISLDTNYLYSSSCISSHFIIIIIFFFFSWEINLQTSTKIKGKQFVGPPRRNKFILCFFYGCMAFFAIALIGIVHSVRFLLLSPTTKVK